MDEIGPGEVGFDDGLCSLCGRPTVRPVVGDVEIARGAEYKEPFVCNKCLVDLRGDMVTELEVRRQIGTLEARMHGLESRYQTQNTALQIVLAVCGFLAGVAATFVVSLLLG